MKVNFKGMLSFIVGVVLLRLIDLQLLIIKPFVVEYQSQIIKGFLFYFCIIVMILVIGLSRRMIFEYDENLKSSLTLKHTLINFFSIHVLLFVSIISFVIL